MGGKAVHPAGRGICAAAQIKNFFVPAVRFSHAGNCTAASNLLPIYWAVHLAGRGI